MAKTPEIPKQKPTQNISEALDGAKNDVENKLFTYETLQETEKQTVDTSKEESDRLFEIAEADRKRVIDHIGADLERFKKQFA